MIYISILALVISLVALLFPFLDKNNRRGYMIGKLEREALKRYHELRLTNILYNFSEIPLTWMYTAYHLRPELVNKGTVVLKDYFMGINGSKQIIVYVGLKDYKMVSEGTYKLLIHDPTLEVWTLPFKIDREFIEKNLDCIIRVEAEILGRNSANGIITFHPEEKGAFLFNPIGIESTNTPVLLYETHNNLSESR